MLRCEQPRVLRLLTITGLTKLFTIETQGSDDRSMAQVPDSAVG